jgi:DNA-binding MarR family transcriptional regulator
VNPEPFLQLDRVIHEKGRLAIMSMLAASPELSFTELRDALAMTDGNLTTHIRALQKEGYVSVAKSYQNNRPLTTCSLTAPGRKAFAKYINLLEQIVRQTNPGKKCLNIFKRPWSFTLCSKVNYESKYKTYEGHCYRQHPLLGAATDRI